MEEGEALCEIARLLEELLSAAISRAAPRDACRAAAVSPAFRAAADSDAVWPTGIWFDRETGAKCYILSARALVIIWGGTSKYWRWIPLADSRFTEAAELIAVCWLEILGKIDSMMLSPNSTYAAVLVFKIADVFYHLDTVEGTVDLGGTKSTREVALTRFRDPVPPEEESTAFPQTRADGWMEVELGEFFNEEGEDGNVSIRIFGKGPNWKRGLIVQGIEIRIKKSGR
uniref:F-box domain-containing protein n=1 Tax=Oryza punctata TaxID=4537 RepID=A0A0E0K6Q0_ORYPU